MGTGTWPRQAVELEGMGERPVGEGRGVRLDRGATAEDMAPAARSGALGVADHDPAPRHRAAANDRGYGVGDTVLRAPHDLRGQILIPQSGSIFGEPDS